MCCYVSHTSDRWDMGYPFGKQDKATRHRCLRIWLWLPSTQFLQHAVHAKANECMVLLVWTVPPPLPPTHLLSSSPTSNALRRSLTTAGGATVPVDRLMRYDSSGDCGFSQFFPIRSIRDLMSASSFLILGPYIVWGSLELPWSIMSLSVFRYTALYSAVK